MTQQFAKQGNLIRDRMTLNHYFISFHQRVWAAAGEGRAFPRRNMGYPCACKYNAYPLYLSPDFFFCFVIPLLTRLSI